eukprot:jgi/Botrbrau1/2892/Bobra.0036s0034.1
MEMVVPVPSLCGSKDSFTTSGPPNSWNALPKSRSSCLPLTFTAGAPSQHLRSLP